jgi:hypothetical protein
MKTIYIAFLLLALVGCVSIDLKSVDVAIHSVVIKEAEAYAIKGEFINNTDDIVLLNPDDISFSFYYTKRPIRIID